MRPKKQPRRPKIAEGQLVAMASGAKFRVEFAGDRMLDGVLWPWHFWFESRLARVVTVRGGVAVIRVELAPFLLEVCEQIFLAAPMKDEIEGTARMVPGIFSVALDDLEPVAEPADVWPLIRERAQQKRRRSE